MASGEEEHESTLTSPHPPRLLLHADADSFYASVAMRNRPELRDVPMAVVAHVFVASANYPARALGVTSGMLARDAQRLVRQLVLIDVDRDDVELASEALFDLFGEVARIVEPGSNEEAFLDIGASNSDDALDTARLLRRRSAVELGLPVSVGIGRTKLMAKLGSRAAKPDGVHFVGDVEEANLRVSLPLGKVWGIGARTIERLRVIDVHRLGDLDRVNDDELAAVCGVTIARRLISIREGTDSATLRPVEARSALSAEVATSGYGRPDWTPGQMLEMCVKRACRRAQRAGLVASGITVTLRPERRGSPISFKHAEPSPTNETNVWLSTCREKAPRPVPPLTGLRVTLTGLAPHRQIPETLF